MVDRNGRGILAFSLTVVTESCNNLTGMDASIGFEYV